MAQTKTIGRRKTSTARVYLKPGNGEIVINDRPFLSYFPQASHQNIVLLPLRLTNLEGKLSAKVTVAGGGVSGQAGAIQHGLARAIDKLYPDLHNTLKEAKLLTRDDRMVERKKYGRPKARKSFQFSKR
jgi:small subunit ribosomal protein S9